MSRYNIRKYPYADGTKAEPIQYSRFMDVDLDDFLSGIAEKLMPDCPIAICSDIKKLREAAASGNPDDRCVIWHVNNHRTHMIRERDAFIRDTPAYNYMTKTASSSPDMHGYIIEITGCENNVLKGNVFEAGNHDDYAWHIKKTALPLHSVTLKYGTGLEVDVEHYEYARDYRHYMFERGTVSDIEYHPLVSTVSIQGLLRKERSERMELPVGRAEEHMIKLGKDKAVNTAVAVLRPQKKPSLAERLAVAEKAAKAYNEQNRNKKMNINTKKEIF